MLLQCSASATQHIGPITPISHSYWRQVLVKVIRHGMHNVANSKHFGYRHDTCRPRCQSCTRYNQAHYFTKHIHQQNLTLTTFRLIRAVQVTTICIHTMSRVLPDCVCCPGMTDSSPRQTHKPYSKTRIFGPPTSCGGKGTIGD